MNMQFPEASNQDHYSACDIFSVLGEPEDPNSAWVDLKFTELSGCDYIFLSSQINAKLVDDTQLSDFLIDVYQLIDSEPERAKLFVYTLVNGHPVFYQLDVQWRNGIIAAVTPCAIDNPSQKEFIHTLYAHSEMLAGSVA